MSDQENLAILTARINSATAVVVSINPPVTPTPLDFTEANAAADALDTAIAALQAKLA